MQAALLIGTDGDTIDGLFGKTGDTVSGSLLLSDAHILHADEIDAVLEGCSGRYGRHTVLGLFTSIRASTRIEDDTASENSLRFTRVVNKISPLSGDNLCFMADVSLDERYRETFADICRALRHIGYNRSRGVRFGVSC